jgi:hypothetical protein
VGYLAAGGDAHKTSTTESENEQGPDIWYSKVGWLMDHVTACPAGFCILGTEVSVDEAMIKYIDRTYDKYHMRNKPIPEGYKMFVLAESGCFLPTGPLKNASSILGKQ